MIITTYEDSRTHLCYDCFLAANGSCPAYEGMTKIIEENFDVIKILFQVPECEDFVSDTPADVDPAIDASLFGGTAKAVKKKS